MVILFDFFKTMLTYIIYWWYRHIFYILLFSIIIDSRLLLWSYSSASRQKLKHWSWWIGSILRVSLDSRIVACLLVINVETLKRIFKILLLKLFLLLESIFHKLRWGLKCRTLKKGRRSKFTYQLLCIRILKCRLIALLEALTAHYIHRALMLLVFLLRLYLLLRLSWCQMKPCKQWIYLLLWRLLFYLYCWLI